MLDSMGCETWVDLGKLVAASPLQQELIPSGVLSGHLLKVQNHAGRPMAPPA